MYCSLRICLLSEDLLAPHGGSAFARPSPLPNVGPAGTSDLLELFSMPRVS